MQWRIAGVCFWLHCRPRGCRVRTSVLVGHFNPVLVVTAPNALGASPWLEMAAAFGAAQVAANAAAWGAVGAVPSALPGGDAASAGTPGTGPRVRARPAEAFGHPANPVATVGGLFGLACPATDVAPLFPYFLSGLDAIAWTGGLTELAYSASWLPGQREIGHWPLNTWGSVFPRTGMLVQPEQPKAAAVIAQRTADIVTRRHQPHVYTPVGAVPGWPAGGMRVWPPSAPVREMDPATHHWQMLRPLPGPCELFGRNDTWSALGWAAGKQGAGGNAAFTLWRPYTCCQRRGIFLGRVVF
ncbi:MAG: TIGR03756 family integrating conjugative element protein [Rhodospirillales bacterium]|nr:MAG: TIGR03756 family integrating conjugative element protein [Rhodospirillales bacterium]